MATDFPIEITDPDGSVRIAGLADFTDPDNAPAGTNQPFQPASGQTVVIVEDADGDDVMDYSDDDERFNVSRGFNVAGVLEADGGFGSSGESSIGSSPTDTVSFYGVAAVAQPQVPATPLPQDIVDALVLLGIVSQAS